MRYQLLIVVGLLLHVQPSAAQGRPSTDSIRRLAPGAFADLPATVRRDLEHRGCSVPQPHDAHAPANVIHGAFTATKAAEWAILCSVRDTSQILIYRSSTGGGAGVVDSLQRSADLSWVQGIGDGRWGYSQMLRTLPLTRIRGWRRDVDGHVIPQPIDHDAIEQLFLGKAGEAYYLAGGRVYRQITSDDRVGMNVPVGFENVGVNLHPPLPMRFRSIARLAFVIAGVAGLHRADCQVTNDRRPDTLLTAKSSVTSLDSAGQRWLLLDGHRYVPVHYYRRSDEGPHGIIIHENTRTLCCVQAEREAVTVLNLEAWSGSVRRSDRPLWRASIDADRADTWDEFYRSTLFGCCGALDEVAFFSIISGGPVFVMSARGDTRTALPSLSVPNTDLRRLIAFHDYSTAAKPPEALTDSLVVGVLQYGPPTGPTQRVVVRQKSSPPYYALGDLRFVVKGKSQPIEGADLWAEGSVDSAKALSGFSIRVRLDPFESDGPIVRLDVPVVRDKPDLQRAVVPPGFTLRMAVPASNKGKE